MPGGLVALLDDVSIIARAAAASVDDITVAAGRAGILILGGCYLSYEGAEKVMEKLGGQKHGVTVEDEITDPAAFEKQRVNGAIRTDLILSAEIMAITLNEVAAEDFIVRAGVLAIVGIGVTLVVYGSVALIVKLDDIGLHLREKTSAAAQAFGQFLVTSVPYLLTTLSFIGTIAMLWVGVGIWLKLRYPGRFDRLSVGLYLAMGWSGIMLYDRVVKALPAMALGFVLAILIHKVFKIGITHGDH